VYDHVRYYTNKSLTEWDWHDTPKPVIILLEVTIDTFSLRTTTPIGKVLLGDKIRYVYMDDMKTQEGKFEHW